MPQGPPGRVATKAISLGSADILSAFMPGAPSRHKRPAQYGGFGQSVRAPSPAIHVVLPGAPRFLDAFSGGGSSHYTFLIFF